MTWRYIRVVVFIVATSIFFTPIAQTAEAQFGDFSIPLPGLEKNIDKLVAGGTPVITYAQTVINLVIGLIVAIALISIVVAGYMYMTAGGSGDRVTAAKTIIGSAIVGLVLALTAFLLLNTIAPQFASELVEPKLGRSQVNQPVPIVEVQWSSKVYNVPETVGTFPITMELSKPLSKVTVFGFVRIPSSPALANNEYTLPTGDQVVFQPGVTRINIPIQIIDDTVHEPTESLVFKIVIVNDQGQLVRIGTNQEVTISVKDNDPDPSIQPPPPPPPPPNAPPP